MIRKIPIESLTPGMYVVDLHRGWLEHSLWRQSFLVTDQAVVAKLMEDGICQVSIDTGRGIDLPAGGTESSPCRPEGNLPTAHQRSRGSPVVSLREERRRAGRLLAEARGTLSEVMRGARARRMVEVGRLEPIVTGMLDSIQRHPDALVPLARRKPAGSYAADHALASTALMIALACRRRLAPTQVEKLALGALLKDIGQARLDPGLIGKSGKFSQDELSRVRSHVEMGLALLKGAESLPDASLAVVLEHHERFDGSGYPGHKAGEGISPGGRMAAIVDTYDAMTSERPYRRSLPPAAALRQIYTAGGSLFDPDLVASFVRTVGIYPVGTLVRLESGHLGVVEENCQDQPLCPVVRVMYHTGRRQYVAPVHVDLAGGADPFGRIVRVEDFRTWGINPLSWQPA